jgi:UDP-3-O-[3-hydroxymyristoyl] glucosamine N-acyltransferase
LQLKASDIAARVSGRLEGNGGAVIVGAAGLAEAKPGDVAFVRDARDAKTSALFKSTKAGAVLVPRGFPAEGRTVIEVDNPIAAFSDILALIAREAEARPSGVNKSATIDPSAKIGKDARIGAGCVVEKDAVIEDGACLMAQVYVGARSRVGANSILYPQVVLREDVSIGKNCILHPGVVIGADGYGFFYAGGKHNKIPQVGTVIVEDDVEIGANSCVDRAMTGATVVGKGTKIDNLVQVAHNVQVGPHCLLIAQVGIGGSCKIGAGVILAGQAGLADHLTIGDGARVAAQAGVMNDVAPKEDVWGTPSQPAQETLRQVALIRRLPELFKEFKKLKEIFAKHG